MTRTRLTLPLVAVALGLAACGSDEEGEPIPQDVAAAIEGQLDNIQGQLDDGSLGACEDIKEPEGTFDALESAVGAVPGDVERDVRDALNQSVDRLSELVNEECSSLEDAEPTPSPTETIEVPTIEEEVTPTPELEPETVPEPTPPSNEGDEEESPDGDTPGGGGGAPAPEEGG